jgi:hypothetical protein
LCQLQHKIIGFLIGMKIDYIAILTASLNKAIFVLNLSKKQRMCHLQHKMTGFLRGMKIVYLAKLTAS